MVDKGLTDSSPFAGFAVPNFSALFLFFSSSTANFSFISLSRQLYLLLHFSTYGVNSSDFGLAAGSGAFALAAAGAGAAFSSFLSGSPNLAARLASTSSLIPRGALSIAPTFSFFSGAGLAAGVEAAAGVDGFGLDAVGVGFGLNAIPNRSARDFIAC